MDKTQHRLPPPEALPRHLAVIMDGNGRWAKKRGLPRQAGHRQGAKVFERVVHICQEAGIAYLTVYAFSTENWRRPPQEIEGIMTLLREYLRRANKHLSENVRTRFIGDRSSLPSDIVELMQQAEEASSGCTGLNLNIAVNYGGRQEITQACIHLAAECLAGKLQPSEITEEHISSLLYTAGQPEPDLILRPSGEKRTSGFLPWQSSYSELIFQDVLWPDFNKADFIAAMQEYAARSRRFGGI